jgi:hypothetical protein
MNGEGIPSAHSPGAPWALALMFAIVGCTGGETATGPRGSDGRAREGVAPMEGLDAGAGTPVCDASPTDELADADPATSACDIAPGVTPGFRRAVRVPPS